jgi:PhzF family phenazine biosynthesis protein
MSGGVPIYQVDAFTDMPFSGNPAAICPLEGPADRTWMQRVAREMNLSETAFLHPEGPGFALSWFTPAIEVDLCGHATLAAAHVLWEEGIAPEGPIRFITRSGMLGAERRDGDIWLDFPADPPEAAPTPEGLEAALGARAVWVGKGRFDLFVAVESEAVLAVLQPDMARLAALPYRGVTVTAQAKSAGADFASRFFAPVAGIPEDPVTGSAHCTLAPFWAERLGRQALIGRQLSERGGTVRVRLGPKGERVALGGQAVTVLRGRLTGAAGDLSGNPAG